MDSQQEISRALNLAGNVFKGKMCLDEALVLASAANMLPALVESLNVLAEGSVFALAEMEQRVHSGEAQWAMEGRTPRLELPPELKDKQGESTSNSLEWVDVSLKELDVRMGNVTALERDLTGQIEFLNAVERHRPTPPNPWLAGILILSLGLVICASLAIFVHSLFAAFLSFVVATGMGAMVSLRDWKKYKEFLEKVHKEDHHRRLKKDQCQKDLENARNEIAAIMQEATKIIGRLESAGPESVHRALAAYPRLFWNSGKAPKQQPGE